MIYKIKYWFSTFSLTKKKREIEWIKGFKANLILKRMALLHLHVCLLSLSLFSMVIGWKKKKRCSLYSLFCFIEQFFLSHSLFFSSFETLYFNCTCICSVCFSSFFIIIIDLIEHVDDKVKQIWHWKEVYGRQTNQNNTLNIYW
jgi:hypothetical protein